MFGCQLVECVSDLDRDQKTIDRVTIYNTAGSQQTSSGLDRRRQIRRSDLSLHRKGYRPARLTWQGRLPMYRTFAATGHSLWRHNIGASSGTYLG